MRALARTTPLVLLLAACTGEDGGSRCVRDLDLQCAPLYTPDFEHLHAQTLAPSCAVAGGACHASAGAQGGLVLETIDGAYAALQERLVAGDPACSEVVKRLEQGGSAGMPPGAPLAPAERCVFARWIADGALR